MQRNHGAGARRDPYHQPLKGQPPENKRRLIEAVAGKCVTRSRFPTCADVKMATCRENTEVFLARLTRHNVPMTVCANNENK